MVDNCKAYSEEGSTSNSAPWHWKTVYIRSSDRPLGKRRLTVATVKSPIQQGHQWQALLATVVVVTEVVDVRKSRQRDLINKNSIYVLIRFVCFVVVNGNGVHIQ